MSLAPVSINFFHSLIEREHFSGLFLGSIIESDVLEFFQFVDNLFPLFDGEQDSLAPVLIVDDVFRV